MIIGEIRRYLRDNNMIRVSRSLRDRAYKALSAKEALSVRLSREATLAEIVEEVNRRALEESDGKTLQIGQSEEVHVYSEKEISDALDAVIEPVSLYEPVFSDNGDSLYILDQVCDKSADDSAWCESIAIGDAVGKLSERENTIINMRFFMGKTQMEVAGEIGISQAQVSRLEKSALEFIRKNI